MTMKPITKTLLAAGFKRTDFAVIRPNAARVEASVIEAYAGTPVQEYMDDLLTTNGFEAHWDTTFVTFEMEV